MAQNIYNDPEFLAGYSQLPRQREGHAGAPEWPALRDLLPEVGGLDVADLGCGFGWFSKWAADQGAASVLGLDVSSQMLDRARTQNVDAAITYRIADLEQLELPGDSFDLSFGGLQQISEPSAALGASDCL